MRLLKGGKWNDAAFQLVAVRLVMISYLCELHDRSRRAAYGILQANGQPDNTFIASFGRFSALELFIRCRTTGITESIGVYLKGKQRCQKRHFHQLRKAPKGRMDAEFHGTLA